ncbi:GH25 family lysozyme [Allisonella histaminiformans]|uniref:GH25 family lysozyme n=1 Tax=Allisonella histaminiformans TaxID=209880 RepID=UPI002E777DE9|nr:GH25 family lysozyme [Allisonella histaminiformans]
MRTVIDISKWNRGINFNLLRPNGIYGVIIRIGCGTNQDPMYKIFLSEVKKRKIPWGVYLYSMATTPDMARKEAGQLVSMLGGQRPQLGVWLDIEDYSQFKPNIDTTAIASAFIVKCNQLGHNCGIYTSRGKCSNSLKNSIRPNALASYVKYWIAEYNSTCRFKSLFPSRTLAGWQYTDKKYIGTVKTDFSHWYE